MLDLNPFSFLVDWYTTKALEKWLRVIASCGIGAFIGFWGTMGITGLAVLGATHSALFALASGFFSACLMMAVVVLLSIRKSGAWKDLSIVLPASFQKILENTDMPPRTAPAKRPPELS